MSDFIARDAVYHTISSDDTLSSYEKLYFRLIVSKIPSEAVVPVQYGRWVFDTDGGTYCSRCNKRVRNVTGGINVPVDLSRFPYCPNCGVEMVKV